MASGDHLSAATKDKVVEGGYMDIFSLLFRELEKKDKENMDEQQKKRIKWCTRHMTIGT